MAGYVYMCLAEPATAILSGHATPNCLCHAQLPMPRPIAYASASTADPSLALALYPLTVAGLRTSLVSLAKRADATWRMPRLSSQRSWDSVWCSSSSSCCHFRIWPSLLGTCHTLRRSCLASATVFARPLCQIRTGNGCTMHGNVLTFVR